MTTAFALTRAQVRDLDRRAVAEYGLPGLVLMENAGRGAAERLQRLHTSGGRFLILCGLGNNGGDGFVMARHLQNAGVAADVVHFGTIEQLPADARTNAQVWAKCGPLWTTPATGELDVEVRQVIAGARGWVVDALFGTGLSRPLGEPFAALVEAVNARGLPVFAVDVPSGLDCDTGRPLGPTIRATHTATFVAPKVGFRDPAARPYLGTVSVIDIGAPKKLVDEFR
jgi:NAD(P)H-hydrate epimerase